MFYVYTEELEVLTWDICTESPTCGHEYLTSGDNIIFKMGWPFTKNICSWIKLKMRYALDTFFLIYFHEERGYNPIRNQWESRGFFAEFWLEAWKLLSGLCSSSAGAIVFPKAFWSPHRLNQWCYSSCIIEKHALATRVNQTFKHFALWSFKLYMLGLLAIYLYDVIATIWMFSSSISSLV